TLRNLPAEVVDKIQIYTKMSDQSEFTGFDDGQSSKAMNIITKKNYRNGQFGKANVGYGSENKYIVSGVWNIFNDAQRISLLGLSNNVNQQNFSFQDILDAYSSSPGGGGGRGGFGRAMGSFMGGGGGSFFRGMSDFRPPSQNFNPGDYFVGQLSGLSKTHALGLNYSDTWWDAIDVSGSYFVNYSTNSNEQSLDRDYLLNTDSLQKYTSNSTSNSRNMNHRFNLKLNWQIDTMNSVMLRPSFSTQFSESGNNSVSSNFFGDAMPLNTSNNTYSSNSAGFIFSNDLLFRHKFATAGRTISMNFSTSYNDKTANASQSTLSDLFQRNGTTISDSLQIKSKAPVTGYGWSANVTYTEPIHKDGMLQANYTISYNRNNSDKRTYDFNYLTDNYDILDTLLSNKFDNDYMTHRAGLGYRMKTESTSLQLSLDYQQADLVGNQEFPQPFKIDYSFRNFLPSLRFNYKFSLISNLNIDVRTNTNVPSISQLQNVADVSNPMNIAMGNPELKQSLSNSFIARYTNFSNNFTNVFITFFTFNYRTNYIANSTYITTADTTINGSVLVPAGGQITKPVNLDGFYSSNGMFTYGLPWNLIKSNLNFNIGGNYTHSPSLVNNQKNFSDALNLNLMFVISSNITQDLDFTASSRVNFTTTKNTLNQTLNNNYNNYMNRLNLKWVIWEGFFFETDLTSQYYTGLVQSNNNNYTIWNLSLGKKLFNNVAEIKFSVYDALNQNKSINTNITDYYVEYSKNYTLQRYFMLTFNFNLKQFQGKGGDTQQRPGFIGLPH
ncbi:MAG: outer membrane beta-barrel protein, partial [Bacteroidota bacterium]